MGAQCSLLLTPLATGRPVRTLVSRRRLFSALFSFTNRVFPRRSWSTAVELGNKDGRRGDVGENSDLCPGPRERHMEDSAFAFLVVAEPVGEKPL